MAYDVNATETLALSETLTVPNYHALSRACGTEAVTLSYTITVPNYHELSTVAPFEPLGLYEDIIEPGTTTSTLLLAGTGWTTDTLQPYAKWAAGLLNDASAVRYATAPFTAAEIHAAGLTGLD